MDEQVFVQHLRNLSLEDGKAYIREHIEELGDHAVVGMLIADEARKQLYTPFVSLKLAELLIFFSDYIQHLSSHALGLKAKGDALVQIGHHQAAMKFLDEAGEEFLSLEDEGNWARSRISWITACAWLGQVEEALQEAKRARDVFVRLEQYYWACVIDHNTAVIYEQVGRYRDAVSLYERMREIYPTITAQNESYIKRSTALVEMNQAVCLSWLGDFQQAHRLQEQAYARFAVLEEIDLMITSEVNLADLDYMQGYYGSALRRYYQVRDSLIQNKLNNPMLVADLGRWMANCLVKLNRAQEACRLAAEVVETERQFGVSLNLVYALREYAVALVASGRATEAVVVLDEALLICDQRGVDYQSSATKLQQAELLLSTGAFIEAYNQASSIKEHFDDKGLISYSTHVNLVMARTLLERAQQAKSGHEGEQLAAFLQEARLLCEQIVLRARQYNLQEAVYKAYYLLGQIFALQENLTKTASYYEAAINQIENILDDLIYDLSPSFLHTTWAVYEDTIALCLQQEQTERAFGYLEQARSMALRQYLNKLPGQDVRGEQPETLSVSHKNSAILLRMQQELKDWQERYRDYSVLLTNIDTSVSPSVDRKVIQAELKHCETKLSELFERLSLYQAEMPPKSRTKKSAKSHAKHSDNMLLHQQLAPNQTLLAYFLYKGKLVIFAATSEGLISHEIHDGGEQLERLLPLLYARLLPTGWLDSQHPQPQVVRGLLQKLYNLLVAPVASLLPPSGSLTIVPYGLLHNLPFHALYNGSRYLIEDFQINYLPASNMLLNSRSTNTIGSMKEPLIFGYSGKGQLQRALEEAKYLATMLNGNCYIEGEATIDRLMNEAAGSPIIHLATHGYSRLDAPNFSSVLLADGRLNAIDAFSLDLKECELVTLSGCETGLSLSGGGDEQLGLGRAFLAAGAKSLVMSLWTVEDNATNELMQLFYQHLLNGESKVQALRAAQCSLLGQESSIYTHPYFWAAFRLVGDVSPLIQREQSAVLSSSKLNH